MKKWLIITAFGLTAPAIPQSLPFPGPGLTVNPPPLCTLTSGSNTATNNAGTNFKNRYVINVNDTLACGSAPRPVRYCIIGGGAGGGAPGQAGVGSGGGGAGGMLIGSGATLSTSNSITIGTGGGPGSTNGIAGQPTMALGFTANGGGFGGGGNFVAQPSNGGNGGSGGGDGASRSG